MPIYTNVGGASKSLSSISFNNNGSSKKLTTIYSNINGSSKKIFPVEQTIYTWKKYVSYISNTTQSTEYGDYKTTAPDATTISLKNTPDTTYWSSSGSNYTMTFYSNFSYIKDSGTFSLSGSKTFTYSTSNRWSLSDIKSNLISSGYIYFLRRATSTNSPSYVLALSSSQTTDEYLKVAHKYVPGASSTTYTYTYSYKEDGTVTSTNQYAYNTSGNTLSYTSNSNNDIRTVYVRI